MISLRHPFLRPALFCSALLAMLTGCERNLPKLTDFYQPDASITQTPLPDFRNYAVVQEKKDAFVGFMLPLIHEANREILAERQLLEHLSGTQTPAEGHPRPLKKLVKKYRIADGTRQEQIDALLEQVNVIPPSLVLAQAANESAWGTSRFAREGNNLFGEWCFSKGCGLVPNAAPAARIMRWRRSKSRFTVFSRTCSISTGTTVTPSCAACVTSRSAGRATPPVTNWLRA